MNESLTAPEPGHGQPPPAERFAAAGVGSGPTAASTVLERGAAWLRVLGLACLALAWLVPNHYPPWTTFYNELVAFVGLGVLALGLGRPLVRARMSNTVWVLAAVALIPACQYAFGLLSFSGDAWVSAAYLFGFAAAIALGTAWAAADSPRAAELLCVTILAGAVISCGLAALQARPGEPWDLWLVQMQDSRAGANLAQPNNLATLIGLGAVAVLLLRERGRIGRWAASLLLVVLLAGCALTQSRTALFFGVAILACTVLAARRGGLRLRTRTATIALWTIAQWALFTAWPVMQEHLGLGTQAGLMERGTQTPRLQMWPMLIEALNHVPWSGYGWLQVGAAELAVVNQHPPVGELWLHGHNLFIELFVWMGYPLGALVSALVLFWYVDRARKVRSVEALAALMCVTLFGLHAMLELPHHYLYFLAPIGLFIGQLEVAAGARGLVSRRLNVLPVLVAGVLAFLLCRDYWTVESDFRLARFENLRIGTVRAEQSAPNAPFLSTITAYLRFIRTAPASGLSAAQIDEMRAVVRRYPYPPVLARFAQTLALNGRLDEARATAWTVRQLFGIGTYEKMRQEVVDAAASERPELQPLAKALPPAK